MTSTKRQELLNNKSLRWFVAGILFAILWASASTATKIGLKAAQPLVIAEVRFAIASAIMLFVAHIVKKQPLPDKSQWRLLAVYGLLNISIYLGLYVVAMQHITAGIGSLAVASNPVFISFFSVFLLKKKLHYSIILSLLVCSLGVVTASWPLLKDATINMEGLLILFVSMLSYSIGAIYFSSANWEGLSILTINGWQTFLGGLFLLPVVIFFYDDNANHFNQEFWLGVSWLAIPVSIFAIQLWLWLLKTNPVRAGLWLFLCPLFGFMIAAWVLKDVISIYTYVGIILVVAGLLFSRIKSKPVDLPLD